MASFLKAVTLGCVALALIAATRPRQVFTCIGPRDENMLLITWRAE